MFKRNRRKREAQKHTNKLSSLMKALMRAYLKGKGGKAPYIMEHLTILALDHLQSLNKEKQE